MSVRVKLATTPEDIRAVLRVRHRVSTSAAADPETGGDEIESTDEALVDVFDALPTTTQVIAVQHGQVIGGIRVTRDSLAGMPTDRYFDFRARLPAGAPVATCSMLRLEAGRPDAIAVTRGMIRMCVFWAAARGLTYLCAAVGEDTFALLQRFGFDPVGQPTEGPDGSTKYFLILDIAKNGQDYADFVQRPDAKLWMDGYERAFFDANEIVIQRGDLGDEAYLVVEGRADVLAYGAEPGGPIVRSFGPGDLFGELALLVDRPRSATVLASEPLEVMVLTRAEFKLQSAANPQLSMSLLTTIGARFHETIVVLNETEDLNRQDQLEAAMLHHDADGASDSAGPEGSVKAVSSAEAAGGVDPEDSAHAVVGANGSDRADADADGDAAESSDASAEHEQTDPISTT